MRIGQYILLVGLFDERVVMKLDCPGCHGGSRRGGGGLLEMCEMPAVNLLCTLYAYRPPPWVDAILSLWCAVECIYLVSFVMLLSGVVSPRSRYKICSKSYKVCMWPPDGMPIERVHMGVTYAVGLLVHLDFAAERAIQRSWLSQHKNIHVVIASCPKIV